MKCKPRLKVHKGKRWWRKGKSTFTIMGANGKEKGRKRETLKSRRKDTLTGKALKDKVQKKHSVKQCRNQPWKIIQWNILGTKKIQEQQKIKRATRLHQEGRYLPHESQKIKRATRLHRKSSTGLWSEAKLGGLLLLPLMIVKDMQKTGSWLALCPIDEAMFVEGWCHKGSARPLTRSAKKAQSSSLWSLCFICCGRLRPRVVLWGFASASVPPYRFLIWLAIRHTACFQRRGGFMWLATGQIDSLILVFTSPQQI